MCRGPWCIPLVVHVWSKELDSLRNPDHDNLRMPSLIRRKIQDQGKFHPGEGDGDIARTSECRPKSILSPTAVRGGACLFDQNFMDLWQIVSTHGFFVTCGLVLSLHPPTRQPGTDGNGTSAKMRIRICFITVGDPRAFIIAVLWIVHHSVFM